MGLIRQRRPAVWSSFTGTPRAVVIEPKGRPYRVIGGTFIIAGPAATFFYWAVALYRFPFGPGLAQALVPIPLAAVGVYLAVTGFLQILRALALPARAEFDGQVIALLDDEPGRRSSGYNQIVVDDGRRSWTFALVRAPVWYSVSRGDLVRIKANLRSGRLIKLTVTGKSDPPGLTQPTPPGGGPAAWPELLT